MEDKIIVLKDGSKLILTNTKEDSAEELLNYFNTIFAETDNHVFGEGDFNFTVEKIKMKITGAKESMDSIMVIGKINGRIVSYGEFNSLGRRRICHNGSLSISVKKEFWHKGIATAMMKELIDFAKDNNIRNINIEVKADNNRALRLYEQFGFKVIGIHKNVYKVNQNYFDEVLMDLNLW